MHSVHYASVLAQDDRIGEIHFLNEPNLVDDASNRWRWSELEPEVSVNIGDGIERHLSDRQVGAGSDEIVNVPSIQPIRAGSPLCQPSVRQIELLIH